MVLFRKSCSFACLFFACATGCTEADLDRWNRANRWWKTGLEGGDEVWTIECNKYEGPNHVKLSEQIARRLRQVPELNPELVRVRHEASSSRILYGRYNLHYEEAEKGSATHGVMIIKLNNEIKKDIRFIRELAFDTEHPFFSAREIQLPPPDQGPPEWNLKNATGVYTLNVGVTYSTRDLYDYKKAAIEWVRDLRNRGYEAYYYHNPDNPRSSICIGTFGEDAVRIHQWIDREGNLQVNTEFSPEVQALKSREEFSFNLENGLKVFRSGRNSKTGAIAKMPNKSFLVRIPHDSKPAD